MSTSPATSPSRSRWSEAIILKDVGRSGKITLLLQQMQRSRDGVFCNFEDTRLFVLIGIKMCLVYMSLVIP